MNHELENVHVARVIYLKKIQNHLYVILVYSMLVPFDIGAIIY